MQKKFVFLTLMALLTFVSGAAWGDTITLSLDTSAWNIYPTDNESRAEGHPAMENTTDGLKFYGSEYRNGTIVVSKTSYNLTGATLYFKWMANGGGTYMGVAGGAEEWHMPSADRHRPAGYGGLTTSWTFAGSTLISDNTWYYSTVQINSNHTYTAQTATDSYNTGVIRTTADSISDADWARLSNITVFDDLGDNYGSTDAWKILGEVKLEGASAVPLPGAAWLLLSGLAGLGILGRRRRV